MTTTTALVVELHTDGGIRLTTLEGRSGLASLDATRDWITEANRRGATVQLRGDVAGPLARPVVQEVHRIAGVVDERPSAPEPWPAGRTSIQTAAANGLIDQTVDLLRRGSSPNVGRAGSTPYRLAMRGGHADVMVALRDGGATVPRGLEPPAVLPNGVAFRAEPPRWVWWLLLPFTLLVVAAVADGAYAIAPAFVIIPLVAIGGIHLIFRNTTCAIDGPHVARRRGRGWQGPVDLRALDALGFTPPGTARMPVLWMLGQREAGDRANVYAKSAFDRSQQAAIAELRFVPIYAARGFMSPGFERLLARHVDRATVIAGPLAEERVWPV